MAADHSESAAAIQVMLADGSGLDLSDADPTVQLVADNGGWTGTAWNSVLVLHSSSRLLWQVALTTVHSTV